MRTLFSALLWTAVFLLILAGLDQFLVRVPATLPAHVAVASFYRDLRSRTLELATGKKPAPAPPAAVKPAPVIKGKERAKAPASPASVEALIDQRRTGSNPRPAGTRLEPVETRPRYVYADERGEIHFAGTLAEVPEEYRAKAKLLGE